MKQQPAVAAETRAAQGLTHRKSHIDGCRSREVFRVGNDRQQRAACSSNGQDTKAGRGGLAAL